MKIKSKTIIYLSRCQKKIIIRDIIGVYHRVIVNTTHLMKYLYATLLKEHEYGKEEMKAPSENTN